MDARYIGIPYQLGGRDFTACDCYGLVYLYLANHGCNLPRYDIQYTMDERQELIDAYKPLLVGEQVDEPEELSVILFYRGGRPIHMGLVVDGGILHTTSAYNSVWEKITAPSLARYRRKEYYRISDEYKRV